MNNKGYTIKKSQNWRRNYFNNVYTVGIKNKKLSFGRTKVWKSEHCNHVLERYNTKWECKVRPEKRLTDAEIKEFVEAVKPIAFHVLYNSYEDEAR